MINMLGVLMDKVDSKQEPLDNASREIEILKRKMLAIRQTVTKVKYAFDGLISILDTAQ